MTLQQLRYFCSLAETQNMRQAADQLYISQPSLSISLRKLEEELGLILFDRTGHRIRLTAAGRAFHAHALRILQERDDCLIHMKRLAEAHERKISLGCISPVLNGYLPESMNAFLSLPDNADMEFEIEEGNSPALIEKLKGGLLDLLICTEIRDEDLTYRLLQESPLVLVRPKANAAHHPKNYSWEEIAAVPMLGYPEKAALNGLLSDMWLEHGIYPAYRYRMPHEEAILAMVESGFGFAIIPETESIGSYAVDVCPLPSGNAAGLPYTRKISLAWLRGQDLTGAAGKFAEYLQENL